MIRFKQEEEKEEEVEREGGGAGEEEGEVDRTVRMVPTSECMQQNIFSRSFQTNRNLIIFTIFRLI